MTPRILWITADPQLSDPDLRELAALGELRVISSGLRPGEVILESPAGVTAEGFDWLWHPYPLSFVPGSGRVAHVLFALAGRPPDAVQHADRDRELHRVVARRVAAGEVDVVVAGEVGVVAAVRRCGVPVFARRSEKVVGGEKAGLRVLASALDGWATTRWTRRTLRPPIVLVDQAELHAALAAAESSPNRTTLPEAGAAIRAASVVVPTANRPQLLRQSLPSIAAAARRVAGTELVVVEQLSSSAGAICDELGIDAIVVNDDGRGVSRARNIGAARAGGDVVLFTDDDCVVPESWVRDHVAAFAGANDLLATFGAVTGLSRMVSSDDPVTHERRHRDGALPWHVGHGSNMAVRRTALRNAGGWDERIGPGTSLPAGEDADLIVRLLEAGSARSGVGEPVQHIDWRSGADDARNLRAYEFGAGVWIGKALRMRGRSAIPYLRGRRRLMRLQWDREEASPRDRARVLRSGATFVRGLAHGLRLSGR